MAANPWYTMLDRLTGKAPPGAKRSSRWRAVRRRFLFEHPRCSVCRSESGLEAHHVVPFFVAPDLELDPENLIALCRRCHLFLGHLGAWDRLNPSVQADAAYFAVRFQGGKR